MFVTEQPVAEEDETRPITTDDEYSAILQFYSAVMGVIEVSRVAPDKKGDNAIEIYDSKGGVRFDMERLNELEV